MCFSSFIVYHSPDLTRMHTTASKDHHLDPLNLHLLHLLQNPPQQALHDLHGVLYINVLSVLGMARKKQAQALALPHLQPLLKHRNPIYRHGHNGDVSYILH